MTLDPVSPSAVLQRLHQAMNRHDIDALVACFHPEYSSEQPVHPERAFIGTEQVRRNWSGIFDETRDFHAMLLRSSVVGNEIWAEWVWEGSSRTGGRSEIRGVTLFAVSGGRIARGRLYMEPVQTPAQGIDASISATVAAQRKPSVAPPE